MQKFGHPKSSEVSDSFYKVSDLHQLVRPEACQQLSLGNVSWCQFQSFTNTLTLQTLCEHSATMGSSKQLCKTLKMKVIDAHNAGEGYKKIAKRCQLAVSTVQNVIKRWQFRGTVEVKMRSGRPRKLWERTARMLVRKANQNPHLTAKNLQEDLADSGVVVHCSTVQRCCTNKTFMEESVEENLTCILIIKSNVRSMQRNIYRSLMRFGNKCCGLMKLK